MSRAMLDRSEEGLDVAPDQVYPIRGMLDLADLMQVAAIDRPDLHDEPWVPVTQPRLAVASPPSLLRRGRARATS